jgi:choline dehydrogenase-like flavoprotein
MFLHSKVLLRSGLGSTLEAYGVEYIRHGRKRIAYAAKEVILSAGAIRSPHILMHSGIGPSSHLSENNVKILRRQFG